MVTFGDVFTSWFVSLDLSHPALTDMNLACLTLNIDGLRLTVHHWSIPAHLSQGSHHQPDLIGGHLGLATQSPNADMTAHEVVEIYDELSEPKW